MPMTLSYGRCHAAIIAAMLMSAIAILRCRFIADDAYAERHDAASPRAAASCYAAMLFRLYMLIRCYLRD